MTYTAPLHARTMRDHHVYALCPAGWAQEQIGGVLAAEPHRAAEAALLLHEGKKIAVAIVGSAMDKRYRDEVRWRRKGRRS